jgi:hypothetical protein
MKQQDGSFETSMLGQLLSSLLVVCSLAGPSHCRSKSSMVAFVPPIENMDEDWEVESSGELPPH